MTEVGQTSTGMNNPPPIIFDHETMAGGNVYDTIPVLDVGPYLADTPGAREELAANIRYIQESIGFYAIVNHGISRDVFNAAYAELAKFFALPLETKLKYKFDHRSVGYIPAKSTVYVTSVINENTKQDLNETFALATDRPDDNALIEAEMRFVGPNPWPTELDGFREIIANYQRQILALGQKMLPLYALALDQPADFFDPFFTDPISWGRYSYYPPAEAEENQFGISPHSDHSFITLLPLSDVPGLQVLTQDGQWLPAPTIPGGIIVNTGEFMNRWTNGRFIATPHRVVPPTEDRYSMAVFFNPDHGTVADPRPTFCSETNPAKYDPVTLMDYVCWYIDRNYSKEAGGQQDLP